MNRWEYATVVLHASLDEEGVRAALAASRHADEDLPIYHIATLEPQLNQWGQKGWELVHFEPVDTIGKKGDLGFAYMEANRSWRRYFLCVFKRPA